MTTAAVIVHFFNWPEVSDTIGDAIASGIAPKRVYFVDNGSEPGDLEAIRAEHPGIQIVAGQGNVGYAGAVNRGTRAATRDGAERVLVLTHEVRLDPSMLAKLSATLDAEPASAVAAPVVYRKSRPEEVWSAGGELSGDLWPIARSAWNSAAPDWVDGCCFLIRVEDYWSIDGMYEPYFLYLEEVDFFARLRTRGRMITVVSGAAAWQEPGNMTLYYATRNRILISRRLASRWVTAGIAGSHVCRLIAEALIGPRKRRHKIVMRARGIAHGLTAPSGVVAESSPLRGAGLQ
jgi:N-acetylglucosaminyl-diphospho-decaprenol L-rhamnosyltransferase